METSNKIITIIIALSLAISFGITNGFAIGLIIFTTTMSMFMLMDLTR